jgi:hypothetical protein
MEQMIEFLADSANWQDQSGIPNRIIEHLVISVLAVAFAAPPSM